MTRDRRLSKRGAGLCCALLIGACWHGVAFGQELLDENLEVEHVIAGLSDVGFPIGLAFLDERTLLVPDRSDGKVRRVDLLAGSVAGPGAVVVDLDIIAPDFGDTQTEYGIQGLELHPDFQTNGWVYIRYDQSLTPGEDTPQSVVATEPNFSVSDPNDNVIERYVWDGAANNGEGALLLDQLLHTIVFDTRYHHGGPFEFGLDGSLYSIIGDLRHQVNVQGNFGLLVGANINEVVADAAVILRMNDDGAPHPDNPFTLAGTERWHSYGVRNSFGLAIDPATGDLWNTSNGVSEWDEINRAPAGHNSGWQRIQGPEDHPFQTKTTDFILNLQGSEYSNPEFSWLDAAGVTGIEFLYGSALGEAYDDLALVGQVNDGWLWAFTLNETRDALVFEDEGLQDLVDDRGGSGIDPVGTEAQELLFGTNFGGTQSGILAIEMGPDGLPYLLTIPGDVFRITLAADCLADCNADGMLSVLDFVCFQQLFASGDPAADANGDGMLNVLDFVAFQVAFSAGCP